VRALIDENTDGRGLGVDVLDLNVAVQAARR
jgi:hypothetical protein